MRIIHVKDNFHPNYGYQINEILNVQKSMNDEIIVISTKDMSYFHQEYNEVLDRKFEAETGIKIIRLDYLFKISSRLFYKDLFKVLDKLKPDIVYMHVLCDFKDFILYRKKRNYLIYRDCHMSWVASNRKMKKIFYKIYNLLFSSIINRSDKYEKIFALGVEEYQYLKKIGINDNKIDYLYHGYNKNIIYYDENERNSIREKYGFSKSDIVISYIGKFDKNKSPDLLIDIVNRLSENVLSKFCIKILFIGSKESEYMNLFNEKLKTLDNRVKVVIDNSKPFLELRKYFSASDICIYPKETTLSSIHAQVCGCPVIMEKHDSNKERVIIQENLFDIGDLDKASLILNKIILEGLYCKKINLKRKKSLEFREYNKQIKKLRNVFEKAILNKNNKNT